MYSLFIYEAVWKHLPNLWYFFWCFFKVLCFLLINFNSLFIYTYSVSVSSVNNWNGFLFLHDWQQNYSYPEATVSGKWTCKIFPYMSITVMLQLMDFFSKNFANHFSQRYILSEQHIVSTVLFCCIFRCLDIYFINFANKFSRKWKNFLSEKCWFLFYTLRCDSAWY